MADLQSPSADWPLATPWARTRRQKRRGEGRLPHWGADRFLTGKSHPRKLHCECALAFKGMLTAEPVMPALMNITKTPGGPAARINLRRMAWVWSGDRPVGEAELAPLLKENFHAALACFDAVRAMVGSAVDGSSLPADAGRVYSSVSTVAIRVGVLRNGDHLGPASLKELEHKMKHLRRRQRA